MRLDGRLEDFSLPDVLRLLSTTHKSGALLLDTGDGEQAVRQGVIRLGSGAVDGASSDLHRHALARRLVGAGLVGDEAIEQAVDDVRRGAPSLIRALLDRAGLNPADIAALAAEHTTDAVCELLRWGTGGFSFRVGESDPDGLALGLAAADLVAEGERRMQVWPSLTSYVPSPDTVMRLAAAPAFDPSCTRKEWGLLALVDGTRSVAEIVALLGRSEFAVAGALAALVERGLLTVSATSSGLADLQRRQAFITALETGAPPPGPQPEPAATAPARPAALAPAAEVPAARSPDPVPGPASTPMAAPPWQQASATQGALALDADRPAHPPASVPETAAARPDPLAAPPTIRGLDSAVTKSLVLRLIAGVREL